MTMLEVKTVKVYASDLTRWNGNHKP